MFTPTLLLLLAQSAAATATYNHGILQALQNAPGIKVTLHTTGIYADDGKFQQTDMVFVPRIDDVGMHFDAQVQFQRGNATITHTIKDSKPYTTTTIGTHHKSHCTKMSRMPRVNAIINTILNGQVVDPESAFHQKLECPESSHRLMHAVWEGLDYFYCYDTTGA